MQWLEKFRGALETDPQKKANNAQANEVRRTRPLKLQLIREQRLPFNEQVANNLFDFNTLVSATQFEWKILHAANGSQAMFSAQIPEEYRMLFQNQSNYSCHAEGLKLLWSHALGLLQKMEGQSANTEHQSELCKMRAHILGCAIQHNIPLDPYFLKPEEKDYFRTQLSIKWPEPDRITGPVEKDGFVQYPTGSESVWKR